MSLKQIVVAVAMGAILVAPGMAKDGKDHSFAGKWVMDKKDSTGSEELAELRQDIKMHDDKMTIQSRFPEPANGIAPLVFLGIMVSSIELSTDGQPSTTQVGPFPFTSKTTINGNTMTTEWNSSFKGDPVQGKWVRTVSDDGKHMTLDITESSTKGQSGTAKLTFKRK